MNWFLLIMFWSYGSLLHTAFAQDDSESESASKSLSSPGSNIKLHKINCTNLRIGQFKCPPIKFDPETEQPYGCTPDNLAPIRCELRPGLICDNEQNSKLKTASTTTTPSSPTVPSTLSSSSTAPNQWNVTQYVDLTVACQYTNGYSLETALLFSIFLGMFGIDRFYLGYPAIGLLKFCTLGFLFLGQFIDIILIAMQIVKPADGSNYIVKYFGARINIINDFHTDLVQATKARLVLDSYHDIYYYPLET